MRKLFHVAALAALALFSIHCPLVNPASLLAVRWNGSAEWLVRFDPATGDITPTATISGVEGVDQGQSTFDATGRRFFLYGEGSGIGDRIFTLDANSGAVQGSVPAQGIVYPTFDPAQGTLLAVRWDGSAEWLVRFDPATGDIAPIATIPGVEWVAQGQSTFDTTGRRFFLYGGGSGIEDRIFTLDADSGAVQHSVPARGIVYPTFDPAQGTLLAAQWDGSAQWLVRFDPATGDITPIATIPGVEWVAQGQSTFDATGRRFFLYGGGSGIGDRIFTLDADSGAVQDSVPSQGIVYLTFDASYGGANTTR